MELVFDERSANSSLVEMIWRTHSERAGTVSWNRVLEGDLMTAKPHLPIISFACRDGWEGWLDERLSPSYNKYRPGLLSERQPPPSSLGVSSGGHTCHIRIGITDCSML